MSAAAPGAQPKLVRRLGPFDATMIVMGGNFRIGIGSPTEIVEAGLERLGAALDGLA